MELLKCRSIWRYSEVELTFLVDLENQYTSNVLKYQDRNTAKSQWAAEYYNMLVSGYAAHDCQMSSNLYKHSENADTDFDSTEPKGDVVIEMSGKYDFKVTRELIEIMVSESKVIVKQLNC